VGGIEEMSLGKSRQFIASVVAFVLAVVILAVVLAVMGMQVPGLVIISDAIGIGG
jgi:hypothetical protein